jgi:hypothetical protein
VADSDSSIIDSIKAVGGVFKFGTGVLGKSAIALGVLLISVIIAVSRLHSDLAILAAICIGVLVFAGWFLYVLKFAGDHPDIALLEGGEWTGWKRFEAAAKGYGPFSPEKEPVVLPGTHASLPGSQPMLTDKEDEEPTQ